MADGKEDPSKAVASARDRLRGQLQRALDAIPPDQLEQVVSSTLTFGDDR